jgi:phosphohistidine swiveling domain-containing protein
MMLIQDLEDCADVSLVGGKAANLGSLLRAGFPVPDGFVMTTAARDEDLKTIRHAYGELTAPEVAVRSSATIEDSSELSTAGQFKTVLNVRTEEELMDAVRLCRASSDSPSIRAYLGDRYVLGQMAMAVVVQRQISADVAGVLFTQAPQHPDEMLIEAAPGLGEDLVSGRAQPDRFRVSSATGRIIKSVCANEIPSLAEGDVARICSLGREVASHFDSPQDIEWAISGGELFLLQARPITTSDRAAARTTQIAAVRQELAQPGRGPWALHNLAETLPHPTPLTWSVLRRFMSGAGGFGAMYRRLGFEPAGREFLELILGRIYMDLSRAPALFGEKFPFAYDPELLRRDPDSGLAPPSIPRGSWTARFKGRRCLAEAQRRIDRESVDFDRTLAQQTIPDFVAWCAEEKKRDLSRLSAEEWIDLWHERERRLFDEFAPEIFFTSFIAATALRRLQDFVAENFWDESHETLTQLLAATGAPDQTTLADAALREVAQGRQSVEAWLANYGHRAIGEFDLAAPRWREIPDTLLAYAARLKDVPDPIELRRLRAEQARDRIDELPSQIAHDLCEQANLAQRYLVFREDGKHYLMLGYDLLRDMVLDASERLNTEPVWLTFDELATALRDVDVPQAQLAQRKHDYHAEARITLPQIIDSAALSTLGQLPNLENHARLKGFAISSGFASGPVRIVESPLDARELGSGYVLVCPSTDPQWTPLFVNASALVLGCGGSLSHGAIVAREMNLPAVVFPDATRLLHEGEHIFVDGSSGVIARKTEGAKPDANDISVAPEKLPPIPGKRERRAARARNAGLILWGLFLFAAWCLPEKWLYQPSLHVLDALLWPLVRAVGRPGAVALVGTGLALLTALSQALLADNVRVREASRRARSLTSEAGALPLNSPRRDALMSIAVAVHLRVIGTGLVPVGILLGIFVLSFTWLVGRMDRSNPAPGSPARVLATIDADFRGPVTLALSPPLRLDESSPTIRSLPPIRETLEQLLSKQRMSTAALDDLQRFLRRGVPAQTLNWIIRSDAPGSFPITLTFGQEQSIRQLVVFGDSFPPDTQRSHDRRFPMRSVKIEDMSGKTAFWSLVLPITTRPLAVGWPWIYLGAYFPAWLLCRRLLRLV